MTSKLQVTIPKAIADAHRIAPGTELEFESAGDTIRVRIVATRRGRNAASDTSARARVRAFDEGTARQRARNDSFSATHPELVEPEERGWSRDDLYGDRGLAR